MTRRNVCWIAASVAVALSMTLSGARATTLHVPADHATIQSCIDAAVSGVDECVVAPGTYVESINFNGKAITLGSSGGAAVTTIDGNGAFHVVQCVSGEGPATVLDGFTITGGNADGDSTPDFLGAGMYNFGSSPTVMDCVFAQNVAAFGGAGMFNGYSDPTVTRCTFIGNRAGTGAGGMTNANSSPTVAECIFHENVASIAGAIANGGQLDGPVSMPNIRNCKFLGNRASFVAGGIYNGVPSIATIVDCTFGGNYATDWGGAVFNDSTSPTIINSTFLGNSAGQAGGGVYNADPGAPVSNCTITNCIFSDDTPDEIYNAFGAATATVSFSNVQGGLSQDTMDGGGNIDADPLFVDADGPDNVIGTEDDDLRLRSTSPCVDAGDNDAPGLSGVLTDLAGNDRFFDVVGIPDTGIGAPPIVDMGAFEVQCGNGVVEPGEVCDDGVASPACDTDCTLPVCGDGLQNSAAGEECDDGNTQSGDGCRPNCTSEGGAIPTVSTWGMVILALVLLTGSRIVFRRRPASSPR